MAEKNSGDDAGGNRPIVERRRPTASETRTAQPPAQSPDQSPAPPVSTRGQGTPPPQDPGGSFGSGPPPGAEPREHLQHDGRFGEIFVLFLVNLLLTLITLGIYRFWGKTRIRKYVWSHTSLRGERLEYTGTGLELFLGFLFALLVFGGPIFLVYVWLFASPPRDPLTLILIVAAIYLIIIPLLFFIYYVAIFAAYRYRISRTAWFGIRGGMEGSAWIYGFLGLGLGILNFLSLGWTKPWADSVVFKYRLSRTWFGSQQFTSSLECAGMYGPFTLAWVGALLAGLLAFALFGAAYFSDFMEMSRSNKPPANYAEIQLAMTAAYLTPFLAYQILVPWYKAALVRNIANTLSAGDVRFETRIKGKEMFALLIPNFLLLLFTLGLAYPYVVLRTARYVARHLEVVGDIEMARIRQTEVSAPWYGEGIMEFLGVGMI